MALPQQWTGEHNCRAKLLEAEGHHKGGGGLSQTSFCVGVLLCVDVGAVLSWALEAS